MRGDPPIMGRGNTCVFGSTPHARGSTPSVKDSRVGLIVYPACAGIHPGRGSMSSLKIRLPRMRGDPPRPGDVRDRQGRSTPHARGSTRVLPAVELADDVYPACAGIHHTLPPKDTKAECLPRMRGDPPVRRTLRKRSVRSTPHARGSTVLFSTVGTFDIVYPACAGIHRKYMLPWATRPSLPRMRGDPPRRCDL